MNDEIKETAKAAQEIAKTTGKAIDATEKLAGFIAKHISEPVEAIVGIIADKLKYIRWERQIRLLEKSKELIKKRQLSKFRIIPPKFAIPLIENACIEENDELQDLWAELLVTSIDPTKNFPRQGFIDILKQFEIVDVQILKIIYDIYLIKLNMRKEDYKQNDWMFSDEDPTGYEIEFQTILDKLKIKEKIYYSSIDNLMRMRMVTYFVYPRTIEIMDRSRYRGEHYKQEGVTTIDGYKSISITSLGVDFVEACIKE